MQDSGGEDGTINTESDDGWLGRVAKIDQKARTSIEQEGHSLFTNGGGKLTDEQTRGLEAKLRKVCAGLEDKVATSMLAITSPTGRYEDNPMVE